MAIFYQIMETSTPIYQAIAEGSPFHSRRPAIF
jgi:hypothetical protein